MTEVTLPKITFVSALTSHTATEKVRLRQALKNGSEERITGLGLKTCVRLKPQKRGLELKAKTLKVKLLKNRK